ncbi:hypothetical protein VPH35_060362 [Triticum aestivum]|uniref:Uncharacterized protein n=1 Tax=Aegilops tauschii TaxID=37682 RepID=M8C6M8_AEGTA
MATSCAKPILRLAVMCGSLRQSFSLHMYVVSSVSSSLRSARTGAADPWLTSSGGVCQESLAAACYIIRLFCQCNNMINLKGNALLMQRRKRRGSGGAERAIEKWEETCRFHSHLAKDSPDNGGVDILCTMSRFCYGTLKHVVEVNTGRRKTSHIQQQTQSCWCENRICTVQQAKPHYRVLPRDTLFAKDKIGRSPEYTVERKLGKGGPDHVFVSRHLAGATGWSTCESAQQGWEGEREVVISGEGASGRTVVFQRMLKTE